MGSDAVQKSTVQRERDCLIRSALAGAWVVAALYLLYTRLHPLQPLPGATPQALRAARRANTKHQNRATFPFSRGGLPGSVDGSINAPLPGTDGALIAASQIIDASSSGGNREPDVPPCMGVLPFQQHMQRTDDYRGRYMEIVVHKGFTNQVFALLNGIAIAHLLNVTLVLPQFSTHYDYKVYSGFDIQKMQFDPAPMHRVDMDQVFDTAALRAAVAPWVDIIPELPEHLKGSSLFARIPAYLVNPKRPETLQPYLAELHDKLVLRIKCPLSSVVWSTPELGQLRKAAITALAPGQEVSRLMASRLDRIRGVAGQAGFIGLHLRIEQDWVEHCRTQPANPEKTQIESFEQCWSDGETVAERLRRVVAYVEQAQGVTAPRAVYVATGQYDQDFAPFFSRGFSILSPANFSLDDLMSNGETKRDLAAAVDYFVMRRAALFMGNVFSSFSFSVRENFMYSQPPRQDTLNSFYYNDEEPTPLIDITPTEALRWRVYAGTAHPSMYSSEPEAEELMSMLCHLYKGQSRCTSMMQPRVTVLKVTSVGETDAGYIVAKGFLRGSGLPWIHTLEVSGALTGPIVIPANEPVYKESPETYRFEFSFLGTPNKKNRFVICTRENAADKCSLPQEITLKRALRRPHTVPFGGGSSKVFIYTGGSAQSGGVESLHKLNAVINSEHRAGRIAVSSVLQGGNPDYRTETSQYVDDITSRDLGPNDMFVVPERLDRLPTWWQYVFDETGARPMQYILGQHTTKLRVDRAGKGGFQSICLTTYFAGVHDCPPKAVLTSAFDSSWIEAGREFRSSPQHDKEDIILIDEDKTLHLDPAMIAVPGAEVVVLRDLTKEQIRGYYRRAKLNVDTYVTGRERALFEGALYNVVPVVKFHAAATDHRAFPLPDEWKWDSWDYDALNRQLAALLENYQSNVPKLQPLIDTVEGWNETFPRQVTAFFGDDVHVMISALGTSCDLDHDRRISAMFSAVFVLLQYPFATVELLVHSKYYFEYDFAGAIDLLYQRGHERRLTVSQISPEYQRLCGVASFFQPPLAKQRRRHALLVPAGGLPFESDLVTSLLAAKEAMGCEHRTADESGEDEAGTVCKVQGVGIEGGMLLVEQGRYYRAVGDALPAVPEHASLARVRPYLEQLSDIAIRDVPVSKLSFFDRKYSNRCARYPLCSGGMQVEPWDSAALQEMSRECLHLCVCSNMGPILDSQMLASMMQMFREATIVQNLRRLTRVCEAQQ